MVQRPREQWLGIMPHHAERLRARHVASGLSQRACRAEIVQRLRAATADRTHQFWPDSESLLDEGLIDATRVHGPRQLTDVYLLALAVRNGGRLVTFDASIAIGAVKGARAQHLLQL